MKKSILTLYIFLLAPIILIAQADWQWGQEVRFNAQSIAVDNDGNSYVTWTLEDPYEIDGTLFISNGSTDAALTSFDCDGVHRWTKIIGGSGGDAVTGLGTDTLGGVYLALNINGARLQNYSCEIGNDTTIEVGQRGFLLVKFETEGALEWFRLPEDTVVFNLPDNVQIGGARDIDVASNGDFYVYSRLFPGTYGDGAFEATFETSLSNGGPDIYVLKYGSNGNCTGGLHFDLWYSGPSFLSNGQITRDQQTGSFYIAGYLNSDNSTIIFGGEEVTAENYVVQFDSDGFVNWTLTTNDVRFWGKPAVDEFGNIYVTGGSANGNSLGSFTFQNTFGNSEFPFFAKIDSMGNVLYATNASVNDASGGKATAYTNNQVAVTGNWGSLLSWGDIVADSTSGDSQGYNVFLAVFDAEGDGTPESFHSLTSSPLGVEIPYILTADRQANFYVGGNFSGQLEVGDGTLYNQTGSQEGFIAKFGSDSCYCPLPVSLFTYDSIPNEPVYTFAYTGSAEVDSITWDFGDGEVGSGLNPGHTFAVSGTYTVCATAYNECGADSVCVTIQALGPVGVKTINGFEPIRVYPNPAQAALYIDHSLPVKRIEVFNAVGQSVQSAPLNASAGQLDVSKLPPGIYLLQLTGNSGIMGYARFVKE